MLAALMLICLCANAAPPPVVIDYFYQAGCADCARVKNQVLPELKERYDGFFVLNEQDVNSLSNVVRLVAYQAALQIKKNEPVMMVVDYQHILNGFDVIRTGLLARIDQCVAERLAPDWVAPIPIDMPDNLHNGLKLAETRLESFKGSMVAFAGLCDGINPCAIGTLVFFMSMLAISGVKGRGMLMMGIPFCLASFVTYTAIGLGLFHLIHGLSAFEKVRRGIELGMIVMLAILAILSLRDAFKYRISGKAGDITLQLPDRLKLKIHALMRKELKSRALITGGLVIGTAVTAIESICTGQVYVPTMVMVIKSSASGRTVADAWQYLLLYNLMFIVPLVTVFVLTYFGMKTATLLNWSRKNVVLSKLLMGAFFVVMAVLIALL